ncbi:MAG: rane protein, partial [Verrucomicrobiaceae bacterium]|nr:rane protein [Verrucomicrobiaceae bacterium]
NLSIEVAAGTLILNKISTSAISAVDLAGGAALIIDSLAAGSAPTVVISGTGGNQISDISSVLIKGDQAVKGVLDLNGLNETIDGLAGTGVVTSNVAGTSTLTVGGNNSAGLAPYTLASASAGVNTTGLNHFGGVIQDGGAGKVMALTKTGSGTQILAGANTYTGATTISAGTLKLGASNSLPSGAGKGDVTIAGTNTGVASGGSGFVLAPGILDIGGFSQAINGLNSSSGGFVTNNPGLIWNGTAWVAAAATNALTVGNNNATASFSGIIQDGFTVAPGVSATGYVGKINLVKTGTGAQTLTGANLYGGTTTIQNGSIIVAGGNNRLPSTTTVTLGNLTDSGVLQVGNGTGAISQTIAGLSTTGSGAGNTVVGGNAANSTLILNQSGTASYSGKFGGAGANQDHLNVTLQGGGTLTFTGTNTHTGSTTVQGGSTLILGTNITSSPLNVGGVGAGTLTGDTFSVGGPVTVNGGGIVAPGVTPSAIGTLTFTNGLAMNGGTLAFQLGSTFGGTPLIGDSINLTGGTFNVGSGFISLADIGGANGIILGTYNLLNYTGSGGLNSLNFNNLSLTSNVIGANNYVATLFNNTALNMLQVIIDNARFWSAQTNGVWDTNGTANWTPGNFFLAGDKVIFADTFPPSTAPGTTDVQLNSSAAPGAVTFTNSTLDYSFSGNGAITGGTGISKSGAGNVVIDLANTFTGNTSITNGSIEMRRALALGTDAGSVSVSGGGELRLSGGIAVGAKALTLNGTGATNAGALRSLSGNNSYAGAITLNGASRISSDAGTLALTGGITMSANSLTFGGAGNITESGIIGGAGSLTVDGTGGVTLYNINTYTGQTFIKNGTLGVSTIGSVGVAGGLGNAPDAATGTIAIGNAANAGTLKWNGSSNETTDRVVDLAGTTGGAVLEASGTSGAVLALSSPLTFTGAGSKTLTLSGTGGSVGVPNVIAGAINDPAAFVTSLLKTGGGVWRLDGMNGYTGSTTINGGTLLLGVTGGLPTAAPTIANASGSATLRLNSLNQTLNGIDFGGVSATGTAQGIVAIGSAGTLTLGGNVTYFASGNPLGASITGSGSATLDLNGAARTFNIASSSGSGGADLAISAVIADVAAGGSLVKTGAGTLVLTGANTYTGATTVNGGVLSASPVALGITSAINVGTSANGELNLYADNSATAVTLAANTNLNVGGGASSGFLGFNLNGASSSDSIALAGTGTLTIGAGGGFVNARALSTLTGPKYLLLDTTNTGPSSIAINTVSGFSLGVLPGGYSYSLDNTTDIGKLYLSVAAAAGGSYYWTGNRTTDSWAQLASGGTASNWSTNQAGTIDAGATPGGVPVIFSADNAGAGAINTTLDQPYSISSLQFIGNTPATGNVSIAAGTGNGTLTVGAGGIDVQTNASSTTTTITAPVVLGAAQSWNVSDAGQTLTVSGVISAN